MNYKPVEVYDSFGFTTTIIGTIVDIVDRKIDYYFIK